MGNGESRGVNQFELFHLTHFSPFMCKIGRLFVLEWDSSCTPNTTDSGSLDGHKILFRELCKIEFRCAAGGQILATQLTAH